MGVFLNDSGNNFFAKEGGGLIFWILYRKCLHIRLLATLTYVTLASFPGLYCKRQKAVRRPGNEVMSPTIYSTEATSLIPTLPILFSCEGEPGIEAKQLDRQ